MGESYFFFVLRLSYFFFLFLLRYLNRIRTDQQQAEEAYEFRWGPRATVLCPVEDILSFIATMNGKANDEKFLANLQDILKANSPADDDEEGAEGADAGATQATQA